MKANSSSSKLVDYHEKNVIVRQSDLCSCKWVDYHQTTYLERKLLFCNYVLNF